MAGGRRAKESVGRGDEGKRVIGSILRTQKIICSIIYVQSR